MSDNFNPYKVSDVVINDRIEKSGDLYEMPGPQFLKLYYRSCNVSGLCVLMAIGLLVLSQIAFTPESTTFIDAYTVFLLVGIVGLIPRTSWGRITGIVLCIIMLRNFPVGTAVGIMGLFAFFKAPELFGEGRITHKELRKVYLERRKNKTLK